MKVSELKLNPNNPQTYTDLSKLVASVRDFPKMMELRPMVADRKSMHVLGGNKRLLAIHELGLDTIPDNWVVFADDLTEAEQKRFIIADNIGYGEWDYDILATEWKADDLEEWGVAMPNWGEDDILDIEEVPSFSESANLNIQCENLEQLEELKEKLGVTANKISYENFIEMFRL